MGLIEEIGDNCYAIASEAAWNGKAEHMQADKKRAEIKEKDSAHVSAIGSITGGAVQGATKVIQHKMQNRELPYIDYGNSDEEQIEL